MNCFVYEAAERPPSLGLPMVPFDKVDCARWLNTKSTLT